MRNAKPLQSPPGMSTTVTGKITRIEPYAVHIDAGGAGVRILMRDGTAGFTEGCVVRVVGSVGAVVFLRSNGMPAGMLTVTAASVELVGAPKPAKSNVSMMAWHMSHAA